jgi:glucosamine--fructose-6-phosphate aminotransferase (isomerizing)
MLPLVLQEARTMCGIVGYIGKRDAVPLLIDGLKRLEYRGYDSCGIACVDDGTLSITRAVGRIKNLEQKVRNDAPSTAGIRYGIGHTRWATHGRPTEENAHPHRDCTGRFIVVHNGIIENYFELKQRLTAAGHVFRTGTDTEVIPHLIESYFSGSLEDAVLRTMQDLEGIYGLVVVSSEDRGKIVVTRNGPPIVIGIGQDGNFIASDIPALLPFTRDVLFLNECELATVTHDRVELCLRDGSRISRPSVRVGWTAESAEKEGYPHFMLKEIFEQPAAIRNTLRGRITKDFGVALEHELGAPELFAAIERVRIVACGTSLHAGLVGKFLIESLADMPVDVDYASEFRYRNPRIGAREMVVAITQSGETADTLAAIEEARAKDSLVLSICNVNGSMAARQSDSVLYTHAGPEVAVASTKAFSTQLVALNLLALFLGRLRSRLNEEAVQAHTRALARIPELLELFLDSAAAVRPIAERFHAHSDFLFLGRGVNYPVALEGALKLKEISYIHAEGYPAGEMKHGPIALIDASVPVVAIAPRDPLFKKMMSNIEEVKGRDGIVIAVATKGEDSIASKADYTLEIPQTLPLLNPLLAAIPLQLLAYHIALLRGCDVDKPRNLAKSVTVE